MATNCLIASPLTPTLQWWKRSVTLPGTSSPAFLISMLRGIWDLDDPRSVYSWCVCELLTRPSAISDPRFLPSKLESVTSSIRVRNLQHSRHSITAPTFFRTADLPCCPGNKHHFSHAIRRPSEGSVGESLINTNTQRTKLRRTRGKTHGHLGPAELLSSKRPAVVITSIHNNIPRVGIAWCWSSSSLLTKPRGRLTVWYRFPLFHPFGPSILSKAEKRHAKKGRSHSPPASAH